MNAASAPATAAQHGFTEGMPTTPPVVQSADSAAIPDRAANSAVSGAANSAVPILPSVDLDQSLAFYQYLGFRLLGRAEDYLRVALGPVELHLYLDAAIEPVANGRGCYLRFADPAALRDAWSADGVACLDIPGTEDYGPTLFAVVDPGGNTLRFGPLPTSS
jgi:catechol 2,3-dioxygenase-like lactoylglutathione lyase family enzyme